MTEQQKRAALKSARESALELIALLKRDDLPEMPQ